MVIKPTKIFFCGWPGTGTSSAADLLKLCFKEKGIPIETVSTGGLFRGIAYAKYPDLSKNEALAQLEVDAKVDGAIDRTVDDQTLSELRSTEHVIFDSRVAPHFSQKVQAEVGDAFQFYYVYLICSPWTSAKRVAARENKVDIENVTFAMSCKAVVDNRHRIITAGSRYRDYYGISSLRSQVPRWDKVFDTGKYATHQIVSDVFSDLAQRGWLA